MDRRRADACREEARRTDNRAPLSDDDFADGDIFEMEEDYAARVNAGMRRRSDRTGLLIDEESEEEDADPWTPAPPMSWGFHEESGDSLTTDESSINWKDDETPKMFDEVTEHELEKLLRGPSLSDVGLEFRDDGILYSKETGKRLDTSKFHSTGCAMEQDTVKKLELILEAVRKEVYKQMIGLGLRAYKLTDVPNGGEPCFFASPYFDSAPVLAVLLQGGGSAGQWDSRLVLHEGLNAGSQLPFVRECVRRKWAVAVANPRSPSATETDEQHTDASSVAHVLALWEHFVTKSRAGSFAIFAHRYGGFLAEAIVCSFVYQEIRVQLHRFLYCTRLRAVCVCEWNTRLGWPPTSTPSMAMAVQPSASTMEGLVGSLPSGGCIQQVRGGRSPPSSCPGWWPHCLKMTRLWVPSARPVGAREKVRDGVHCLSGGTKKAEKIPCTAMDSMFEYVETATNDQDTIFFGWSR